MELAFLFFYFEEAVDRYSATGKPICLLGDININILRAQTCDYAQQFIDCLRSYALNSLPSNKLLGLYSLPVRILIGACQILSKPLLILLIKYNLVISVTTATQSLLTPISF